jgi:hypothetical protein
MENNPQGHNTETSRTWKPENELLLVQDLRTCNSLTEFATVLHHRRRKNTTWKLRKNTDFKTCTSLTKFAAVLLKWRHKNTTWKLVAPSPTLQVTPPLTPQDLAAEPLLHSVKPKPQHLRKNTFLPRPATELQRENCSAESCSSTKTGTKTMGKKEWHRNGKAATANCSGSPPGVISKICWMYWSIITGAHDIMCIVHHSTHSPYTDGLV